MPMGLQFCVVEDSDGPKEILDLNKPSYSAGVRVLVLALPLTYCVTLGRSFALSGLDSPTYIIRELLFS